jgi:hypothetical protein
MQGIDGINGSTYFLQYTGDSIMQHIMVTFNAL